MKKAEIGMVSVIVGLVLVAVLVSTFFIPQIKEHSSLTASSNSLAYTNSSVNQTFTLSHNPVYSLLLYNSSGSLITTGGKVNYTADTTAGTVTLKQLSTTGTYTANYNYGAGMYEDLTTGERTLFGVLVLAGIIGLVYAVFVAFKLA